MKEFGVGKGDQDNQDGESVNGPKVAADILSRMKPAVQARLQRAIEAVDPAIAQKIADNIIRFDSIIELNTKGLQVLLKEIPHQDLVLSLKTASQTVKDILFNNMSERKQTMVREDLAALPPTRLSEIEQAQRRIVLKMDELRTSGAIRTDSKNDLWV
jgi:flagellar motor switch protein FliG